MTQINYSFYTKQTCVVYDNSMKTAYVFEWLLSSYLLLIIVLNFESIRFVTIFQKLTEAYDMT